MADDLVFWKVSDAADAAEFVRIVGSCSFGAAPFGDEMKRWAVHDAPKELRCGCSIWLCADAAGDVVGFGSLNVVVPERSTEPAYSWAHVPALAVCEAFHGRPEPPAARYSTLVLEFLLEEARGLCVASNTIEMWVREGNVAAAKLCLRCGFQDVGPPRRPGGAGHHVYQRFL